MAPAPAFCPTPLPRQAPFGAWAFVLALALGLVTTAAARPAQASWFVLSGSLGYGHEFHPLQAEQATNIMITPGLSLVADMLRIELGVLGAYGAVRGGEPDKFNLELRPMLRAKIPLIPLYGRVIIAGLNLASNNPDLAYGGALGLGLTFFGVGVFGEVGILPRHLTDGFHWIAEGRLGASYAF
jgi:hypothetical protein